MEYKKNEDGSDALDEQGNPIPVDNTDKNPEDDNKKVIANLVEELKELRLEKGIIQDLLDAKKTEEEKPKVGSDEEKITQLVEKTLKEKESLNAKANKKAAFEKFVIENKEFHPENDAAGLKRQALEKKFNQFNTGELTSIDEFYSVIGDAKSLLTGNDNRSENQRDKNPLPNPPTPKSDPSGKVPSELSPKEIKLMEQTGRTKEQILKIKKSHPDFFEELLEHVRD